MYMKKIHDMCFDCVISMEHQMRLDGTFEEYERKRFVNMKSWLKGVRLKKKIRSEVERFVNEDGSIEEWSEMSWEEVEKIDNDFVF